MVSSIDGNNSVAKVLQQQRQQITNQQEQQRETDQQKEINRQAQEIAVEANKIDPNDRKGQSVNISA